MPAQAVFEDPEDETVVTFKFVLPNGNRASLILDAVDPQISSLLKKNFLFACLVENDDRYNLLGLRGTENPIPCIEGQSLT